MTLIYPEGTPTLGNTRITAAIAVVSQAAPKVATEINAGTSVELSCHLYPAGWNPTGATAKGSKPDRLCSKSTAEQLNRTTYSVGPLQYVYDPQGDDGDAGNEAKELLVEGAQIYFIERMGLDADVAWAVGQKTRTHYLELGPQIESGDRTDENGEFYIMQEVVYVDAGGWVDGETVT